MKKNSDGLRILSYKYLTKCILKGMTRNDIALDANCSRSCVSYNITKLFAKYNASTKFDFIVNLFGSLLKTKNQMLATQEEIIASLKSTISKQKKTIECFNKKNIKN